MTDRLEAIAAVHQITAIYTATPVVEELLRDAGWPDRRRRLLDPSAGDGSIIVTALRMIAPRPGDFDAVARVLGIEFEASAAGAARARVVDLLSALGWEQRDAARAARAAVLIADFLLDGVDAEGFDLIAGNPPYLRYARLPDYFKAAYPAVVPGHATGDLLHAFLDACAVRLAPAGAIAMVTSDRWLLNDGAAALRAALGKRLRIASLGRLDAASAFYRPKDRRRGTPPRIHPVRVILADGTGQQFGAAAVSPDGIVDTARGPTLGDVASVRIAPWVGPAGIFLLTETEAAKFPAEASAPAVDTDDIDRELDELKQPKRRVLITGRHEPHSTVVDHLRVATARLSDRGRRHPFWLPPETITLRLDRPSLLVPRIARAIRAINVPAGILPINHNLSVVAAGAVGLEDIKAILLHPDSQAWAARHALRLENGYLSITTKLLRRLPLPGAAQ